MPRVRSSLRYRVIEGSPLSCHQGEVTLKQSGGRTELHWSIRFRPKIAGTGALLQKVLQARLRTMLDDHLKPVHRKLHGCLCFRTVYDTRRRLTALAIGRGFMESVSRTLPTAFSFRASERSGRQPR